MDPQQRLLLEAATQLLQGGAPGIAGPREHLGSKVRAGPACRSRPWAVLRACSPHGMLGAEHTKPQGAAGRSGGVGVYVGMSGNEYGALAAETSRTVSAYTATGCSLSVAAGVQPSFPQAETPEMSAISGACIGSASSQMLCQHSQRGRPWVAPPARH
jgi:hypothetical protein